MITWQQLSINSKAEDIAQITQWLSLLEAHAITQNADQCTTLALFLPNINMEQVKEFLTKHVGNHLSFNLATITDQDWQAKQADNLVPTEISEKFAVYPENYTGEITHPLYIRIQAIDAFGTGAHPTTYQCLIWLSQQDLKDKVLIDFGCGSGILALAALKLGAKHVYAIDIEQAALDATRANCALSKLDISKLYIGKKLPDDPNQADILIANILANPLCELADYFYQQVKSSGEVVLSGMLNDQTDQVENSYRSSIKLLKINQIDEWPLMHGSKNQQRTIK